MSSFSSITSSLLVLFFALLLAQLGSAQSDQDSLMLEYARQMDKRSPTKKSDLPLGDFIGSLNGASRLRYGKRNSAATMDPIALPQFYRVVRPFNRWQIAKRAASYAQALPAGLLDQLNGAERLRFGRK